MVFGRACNAASTLFRIKKNLKTTSNKDSETLPKDRPNHFKSDSKISPKWNQKWSQNGPVKSSPTILKWLWTSKIKPTISWKSQKAHLGAYLFTSNKDAFPGTVFSCFLKPPKGPRPQKSSQNAITVCKNEGATFSWKATFFATNVQKCTPLGPPKASKNC